MFIVWYCLVSIIYLVLNILEYLFIRVFKFNSTFFSVLRNLLNSFFNSYSLLINNKINNVDNLSTLKFKDLYNEYKFFNSSKNLSLNQSLINFNLNNELLNNSYSKELTLLINLQTSHDTVGRVNLNKISSSLNLKPVNYVYNVNKLYLQYQTLTNAAKNASVSTVASLENLVNNSWVVKYSPSNFMKYIDLSNVSQYNILYLRKPKVFNKGRYSRNRQYYRTGVYWCLYINIIAVIGIYFWFYRFTMNFGYLWWLLFIFIASFIVPKTIKYRLYNPLNLVNSITNDLIWVSSILVNLYRGILNVILNNFGLNLILSKYLKILL